MEYNFLNTHIKTKDHLNQIVSDEDIIYFCYGDFEYNEYLISPRGERDPSLIFDIYNGELKWRDFGMSPYPRDAVEFYIYCQQIHNDRNISYGRALNELKFKVKPGICPKYNYKIKTETIAALKFRRTYYAHEIKYWEDYHIQYSTLNYFDVYPGELWVNKILWHRSIEGDPMFVYLFDQKKSIWKAYRPHAPWEIVKGKNQRKRFYTQNTTHHIQGYKQIPEEGEVLFITKSMKDVMIFFELGLPAIAPHSENDFIPVSTLEKLRNKFEYIIVNYDNDHTGISRSTVITQEHKLLHWNIPKGYKGKPKDPSDLSKSYGLKEVETQINNRLRYYGII